jgi:hypothetical protein
MAKPCKCTNVTRYDDVWQCMLCRRKFSPEQAVVTTDDMSDLIMDLIMIRGVFNSAVDKLEKLK